MKHSFQFRATNYCFQKFSYIRSSEVVIKNVDLVVL